MLTAFNNRRCIAFGMVEADLGTGGQKDKRTKGQKDKRTKGQKDKRTKGQKDKRTKGQKDKRTKGQKDKRTKGQKDKRTKGQKDKRTLENLRFYQHIFSPSPRLPVSSSPRLLVSSSPYFPISLSPHLPITLPVSFNEYISNNDVNLILVKYLAIVADIVRIRSSPLFVEPLEPADKLLKQTEMR